MRQEIFTSAPIENGLCAGTDTPITRELRADEYLRLCVLLDLDPRGYQQHAGNVR